MSSHTLPLTDELRSYLLEVGVREPPILAQLREETGQLEAGRMQICPEQGALMGMLVQLMGASRVLEVGTFTGYSALRLALSVPEGGQVVCCDRSKEWTDIARRYWAAAGVEQRVQLRLGPALQALDALLEEGQQGSFDLSFVDADKESYLAYHERCLQLVRPGGALLYDNVLWGGSVADPDDDRPSTRALRELNAHLATDPRIDVVMIPIGDGLTVCRRR